MASLPGRPAGGGTKLAVAGDTLIVVHEFIARSPDELSLAKGDRIELIERDDDFGDGWFLGKQMQNGQTGLFPEVYTTLAPKPALSGPAMAQAAASRITSPIFPQNGYNAQNPPATSTEFQVPSNNYGAFSPPQQSSTPTSFMDSNRETPTSPSGSTGFPGSLRANHGGFSRVQQGQSSAVMDETMNVIDEHMTDLSMLSVPGGNGRKMSNDSGSQYSSDMGRSTDMGRRPSFVMNGDETDEELETGVLTRAKVMKWSPSKVAEYLEGEGVEKSHCEVFQEEEFSGEVLLGLDQSTILLQELKLGSIGRRMRTWQKIRALQDEVKNAEMVPAQNQKPAANVANYAPSPVQQQQSQPPQQSASQPQPSFTTPNFSRGSVGPHAKGSSMDFVGQIVQRLPSPTQAGAQAGSQGPRPSAASIRTLATSEHSRRQSSVDQTFTLPNHAKQASFDRGWTMQGGQRAQELRQPPYSGNTRPMSTAHLHSMSSDRAQFDKRQSDATFDPSFDPDAGYTSGSELDVKRQRNMARKASPGLQHEKKLSETMPGAQTRTADSRIVSAPANGPMSPMITKLGEPSEIPRSQRMSDIKEDVRNERPGFRAISDAVTGREKAIASSEQATQSPTLGGSSTGTPSTISKDDFGDANRSEAATPLPSAGVAPAAARRKSKKSTSAYTRGLEKKTPQEQMVGCDYSGWMKKKSSNLMTAWKPRFFVLKGRRLSYYYSLADKEEKGLIDISNHRVLPAENDFLTGLHATFTGARSGPTSPPMNNIAPSPASANTAFSAGSANSIDATASPKRASTVPNTPTLMKGDNQTFIFKLLPPRSGLSKAVNFTKPTVHYFAVPSLAEGRSWMAALMKATIDRDESAKVVTTYQQKTISLEKARARRERPPELREVAEGDEAAALGTGEEAVGRSGMDGALDDMPNGTRRIQLSDPPRAHLNGDDDNTIASTRNSSVVSGVSSLTGGDTRSVSGSGSGVGSVAGTDARTSASVQSRHSSSLRNSSALKDEYGQGLGIQGWGEGSNATANERMLHGPVPPPPAA